MVEAVAKVEAVQAAPADNAVCVLIAADAEAEAEADRARSAT